MISIDVAISDINNKIKNISDKVEDCLNECTSGVNCIIELTGSGAVKNVDKYGDGSTYGKYVNLQLGASASLALPKLEFGPYYFGNTPVYFMATVTFGALTGGGTVGGLWDDSRSNPGSIHGNLDFGLANIGVLGEVQFGHPDFVNCGVFVDSKAEGFHIKGEFDYQNSMLTIMPEIDLRPIKVNVDVGIEAEIFNFECRVHMLEWIPYKGDSYPLDEIYLYTF